VSVVKMSFDELKFDELEFDKLGFDVMSFDEWRLSQNFPDTEHFLQHGGCQCKQRYERLCGHRDGKNRGFAFLWS
jgi:hypothetical protein